jgi:hypothetical protein
VIMGKKHRVDRGRVDAEAAQGVIRALFHAQSTV